MITKRLLGYLSQQLNISIVDCKPISGGDISSAYLLSTKSQFFFIKTNTKSYAKSMFEVEASGLQEIENTNSIHTPTVISVGIYENIAYLILEYIETKAPSDVDFQKLGIQLARMHEHTTDNFGWKYDNYIGSLPQSNIQHSDWASFYTFERLLAQLNMAKKAMLLSNGEIPNEHRLLETCNRYFYDVEVSLLHGDLWSGNFIISKQGKPYLIDPAVYYGHREVDIAMSLLFGGFQPSFYNAYFEVLPKTEGFNQRIDLYQLYYLLVHLNIFGVAYYGSVSELLKKYF